jgi:Flp pilus assembly protein TadD
MHVRVELLNDTGLMVAQQVTDQDGRSSFQIMGTGAFRVRVSGNDIEDTVSEPVQIDQDQMSHMLFIHVKPKQAAVQSNATKGSPAVTSAAQLRVPPEAQKAFNRGLAAWQNKDYAQAAQEFEKAVAIYPQFDLAYNNLGVMYAHLNQEDKARAAFEKAVELNDKSPDADRNLARMMLRTKDFVRAEDLLNKSLAIEPTNPGSLTMLAVAEIANGQVDEALVTARKVHAVPHDGYALAHFVAGQALEQKQDFQQASVEYQTYLKENPNGPEASAVKNALSRLSASNGMPRPNAQ